MTNIVALPNIQMPTEEPNQRCIEILEEALAKAKSGGMIAVAIVHVERTTFALEFEYHSGHSANHHLAAGVLGLHGRFSKIMSEPD